MPKRIFYKDLWAMPGSTLHRLLTDGKLKEAEAQYKDINQRYSDLIKRYPSETKEPT